MLIAILKLTFFIIYSYLSHPQLICKTRLRLCQVGYSSYHVLSCLQPSSIRELVVSWTSLLHFLLSLVFFNRSSHGIPVHSSMLSIHRILGFPCFLAPGVVPCMISSPDNLLLFSSRVQSMIISFF